MEIIGAGFGRTGTLSLKAALEMLGFGPCYHMLEVLDREKNPGHVGLWHAAALGRPVDWQALFAGYRSAVDFPTARYWRELSAVFPQAKVLLTVRDPEKWYKSTAETIYAAGKPAGSPDFEQMVNATVWDSLFEGRFEDRAFALSVFNRHNEEVKRGVPAERLLVFQVSEGWEPLCRFLGVPVPETPFPRLNDTEAFLQMIAGMQDRQV